MFFVYLFFGLVQVCTINAADHSGRKLTTNQWHVLNALEYIGAPFTNPPNQEYIDHRWNYLRKIYPGVKLTRSDSVVNLRCALEAKKMIDDCVDVLSEAQVKLLNGWRGSYDGSSSNQLAKIIKGTARPHVTYVAVAMQSVACVLSLSAVCFLAYKAYKKLFLCCGDIIVKSKVNRGTKQS